jgi:hypothetical protein
VHPVLDSVIAIAAWGGVAWLASLFGQLTDLYRSISDLRFAKDTPLTVRPPRKRFVDNVWAVVGGIPLTLVILLGIEFADRLFFDRGDAFLGSIVIASLLVISLAAALALVASLAWQDGLSYAVLRANLAEHSGERITIEQVSEFRSQLTQIDNHKRHIRFGLTDRASLRPVRVKLASVADEFMAVPPTGFGAVRAIRWKTANAYVWLGNPLRLVPTALATLVFVSVVVAMIVDRDVTTVAVVAASGSLVAASASFMLAVLEARCALAVKAAWHAVYQKQRTDSIRLIEELERSVRKGVAGLGDRVTRALQILRDQQG